MAIALIMLLASCADLKDAASMKVYQKHLAGADSTSDGMHTSYMLLLARNSSLQSQAVTGSIAAFSARHPKDPFGALVATLLGEVHEGLGQVEFARKYYQKALSYANDVLVRGEAVQFTALNRLLALEKDVIRRIQLLERLKSDYPDRIDMGLVNYQLGFLHEKAGDFDRSYQSFVEFLSSPGDSFPSNSQELKDISERVQLYNMPRNWTKPSLKQLVQEVKAAIRSKNIPAIAALKAPKSKFFSISWLQERTDFNSIIDFNIERFVLGSTMINFEDRLESYSNANEAYLRSWGWSSYMPVWYLYFRKIDFPADPEFNGTWEWAGVYFGDTYQDSETGGGL